VAAGAAAAAAESKNVDGWYGRWRRSCPPVVLMRCSGNGGAERCCTGAAERGCTGGAERWPIGGAECWPIGGADRCIGGVDRCAYGGADALCPGVRRGSGDADVGCGD
jgi:hypothetical protein